MAIYYFQTLPYCFLAAPSSQTYTMAGKIMYNLPLREVILLISTLSFIFPVTQHIGADAVPVVVYHSARCPWDYNVLQGNRRRRNLFQHQGECPAIVKWFYALKKCILFMRLERNFEMWFDTKLLRAYFIHEKNSNHIY